MNEAGSMDATLAGLLHGCAETPDDSTPHLILADWLEDHGQAKRAELVRLQCKLADWVPDWQERQALIARQDELIAAHADAWQLGPLLQLCHQIEFRRGLCQVWVVGKTFTTKRFGEAFAVARETALIERVRVVQYEELGKIAARPWLAWIPALSLAELDLVADALGAFLENSSHLEQLADLDLTGNPQAKARASELTATTLPRLVRLSYRRPGLAPAQMGGLLDRIGPQLRELDLGSEVLPTDLVERLAPLLPAGRVMNSMGMEFVRIPAGSFLMGAAPGEPGAHPDEGPQHPVTLTRPFWLGRFAVTQQQYHEVMNANPSSFQGQLRPVEQVSYLDALEFCQRLGNGLAEKSAGRTYRLPTEAEWEHACRAGTFTAYHTGPWHSMELMNCQKRFSTSDPERILLDRTADVGSYPPNAFGLYDMHGNVWEWCSDWYDAEAYHGPVVDPVGPPSGSGRVVRGGCWEAIGSYCRAAKRHGTGETSLSRYRGFRVVLVANEDR
jgi:uncharacterized protein (TIGR02996 family)